MNTYSTDIPFYTGRKESEKLLRSAVAALLPTCESTICRPAFTSWVGELSFRVAFVSDGVIREASSCSLPLLCRSFRSSFLWWRTHFFPLYVSSACRSWFSTRWWCCECDSCVLCPVFVREGSLVLKLLKIEGSDPYRAAGHQPPCWQCVQIFFGKLRRLFIKNSRFLRRQILTIFKNCHEARQRSKAPQHP